MSKAKIWEAVEEGSEGSSPAKSSSFLKGGGGGAFWYHFLKYCKRNMLYFYYISCYSTLPWSSKLGKDKPKSSLLKRWQQREKKTSLSPPSPRRGIEKKKTLCKTRSSPSIFQMVKSAMSPKTQRSQTKMRMKEQGIKSPALWELQQEGKSDWLQPEDNHQHVSFRDQYQQDDEDEQVQDLISKEFSQVVEDIACQNYGQEENEEGFSLINAEECNPFEDSRQDTGASDTQMKDYVQYADDIPDSVPRYQENNDVLAEDQSCLKQDVREDDGDNREWNQDYQQGADQECNFNRDQVFQNLNENQRLDLQESHKIEDNVEIPFETDLDIPYSNIDDRYDNFAQAQDDAAILQYANDVRDYSDNLASNNHELPIGVERKEEVDNDVNINKHSKDSDEKASKALVEEIPSEEDNPNQNSLEEKDYFALDSNKNLESQKDEVVAVEVNYQEEEDRQDGDEWSWESIQAKLPFKTASASKEEGGGGNKSTQAKMGGADKCCTDTESQKQNLKGEEEELLHNLEDIESTRGGLPREESCSSSGFANVSPPPPPPPPLSPVQSATELTCPTEEEEQSNKVGDFRDAEIVQLPLISFPSREEGDSTRKAVGVDVVVEEEAEEETVTEELGWKRQDEDNNEGVNLNGQGAASKLN